MHMRFLRNHLCATHLGVEHRRFALWLLFKMLGGPHFTTPSTCCPINSQIINSQCNCDEGENSAWLRFRFYQPNHSALSASPRKRAFVFYARLLDSLRAGSYKHLASARFPVTARLISIVNLFIGDNLS
jgi:hypothetical protein